MIGSGLEHAQAGQESEVAYQPNDHSENQPAGISRLRPELRIERTRCATVSEMGQPRQHGAGFELHIARIGNLLDRFCGNLARWQGILFGCAKTPM